MSSSAICYCVSMPRHRSAAAAVEPPAPETPVTSEPVAATEPAPPTEAAPAISVDDVLKLKHDYENKREAAIQELLKKRTAIEKAFNENLKEIEDQLTELGYTREPDFVPVPASKVQPFRKARTKSAREKVCPICTTAPENPVTGHDGRAHKSQKRKRAFNGGRIGGSWMKGLQKDAGYGSAHAADLH
jgi:hypothetical protein